MNGTSQKLINTCSGELSADMGLLTEKHRRGMDSDSAFGIQEHMRSTSLSKC